MKTLITATLLFLASTALTSTTNAQQQGQTARQQTTQSSSVQLRANNAGAQQPIVIKKVGFRMANWRNIHGDGTKATTDLISTLKKIGCEVKQNKHGGHVDIAFRCPSWKTVSVQNDAQSSQWHQWLVKNKFETVLLNPPATTKLPTVKIRMAAWKTVHAQSAEQAQALKETYELIGCEAVVNNHGDHIDLKFRCPNWSTIALVNSQSENQLS